MLQSFKKQVLYWESILDEKIAIRFLERKTIRSISYRQLAEDIKKCTDFIQKCQLYDQNIALMGDNCYELIVVFWSIICSGNTAVWINKNINAEEAVEKIRFADVQAVFYDEDSFELMEEVQEIYPVQSFVLEEKVYSNMEVLPFSDEEDIDKVAMLMFTSGTTGTPKAVMMSQRCLITSVEGRAYLYQEEGSFFIAAPIHHMFGLTPAIQALYEERELHLCTTRTMNRSLAALKSRYAFMIASMQTMLLHCMEETALGREILDSPLKYICTGASIPNSETVAKLKEYGYIVQNDYGMTETQCIGLHPGDGTIPENAKLLFSQIQVKTVNGEILIKAPSNTLGYYKNPEMTEQLFDDGWIHTGDLGYIDENGYLLLIGRCKNLIILDNGENVSPEVIESKLIKIPKIQDVIVCAEDNKLCAKILPVAENLQDCEEIQMEISEAIQEYNENAAIYNRIRRVIFMTEDFKRTATGKIIR